MSYRLKAGEPIPKGLERILQAELRKTITDLGQAKRPNGEEAVHNARQRIKKTRALFRLLRPSIGNGRFRRENRAVRKTARALSGLRDARVLVDTFDKVVKFYDLPRRDLDPMRRKLRQIYKALASDAGKRGPGWDSLAALTSMQARVATWPFMGVQWRDLSLGFVRSYKKGRRAFFRVLESQRPQDWHTCRKRGKDVGYQCRLLKRIGPKGMGPLEKEAKEFSDSLGEHHDLILLQREMHKQFSRSHKPLLHFAALIERRRMDMENCATQLGRKVYSRKPREVKKWLSKKRGS